MDTGHLLLHQSQQHFRRLFVYVCFLFRFPFSLVDLGWSLASIPVPYGSVLFGNSHPTHVQRLYIPLKLIVIKSPVSMFCIFPVED